MSHHFDTPTAKEDPRINLCDAYLFCGSPQNTVMAMTVNPDAGEAAPDTFRPEGQYAFRFDLNGDAREEVTFKVQFGDVSQVDDGGVRVQSFQIRRATGQAAVQGVDGEMLIEGETGQIVKTGTGLKAYAGLAPDLFAGDAAALTAFRAALYKENRFAPEAFQNHKNFFAHRNVTAIVLEIPSIMIGTGLVHSWATVSLYGHAPEVQVSRWGLPLITHLFLSDPARINISEEYNRAVPADDAEHFLPSISNFVETLTELAGSAANPAEYARQLMARICPTTLPYTLNSAASFDRAGFNGRPLSDDVMDVMLSLATNTDLGDGIAPDKANIRPDFPYFGEPFQKAERGKTASALDPKR